MESVESWRQVTLADARRGFARLPPEVISRFFRELDVTETSGVAGALLLDESRLRPTAIATDYFVSQAKAGRPVKVSLIATHPILATLPFVRNLMAELEEAGVVARTVDGSRLVAGGAPEIAADAAFVVDDEGFVVQAVSAEDGNELAWTISDRSEDIQVHRRRLATFDAQPVITASAQDILELSHSLAEPMIRTAPLARELAYVLCAGNHVDTESCAWYHGLWQYLRILNVVSTPTWHSAWYFGAFAQSFAGNGRLRVLISGAADYSLLAHLAWVRQMQAEPIDLDVSVLDLCETPLVLCRWYGKLAGLNIWTVQEDIRTHIGEYDLITSDAFLTRFRAEDRLAVLQAWSRLLAPGGQIVTTVRVEPRPSDSALSGNLSAAARFGNEVRRRAEQLRFMLDREPDEIAVDARIYASRMTSYAYRASSQLRTDLIGSGLVARSADLAPVPGELRPSEYVRLVAVRAGFEAQ
jgi:hypothetical protein